MEKMLIYNIYIIYNNIIYNIYTYKHLYIHKINIYIHNNIHIYLYVLIHTHTLLFPYSLSLHSFSIAKKWTSWAHKRDLKF